MANAHPAAPRPQAVDQGFIIHGSARKLKPQITQIIPPLAAGVTPIFLPKIPICVNLRNLWFLSLNSWQIPAQLSIRQADNSLR
jgi:hypothetical protein